MKVILTTSVPGLGEAGAIKEVADGYARNFLLPKKLAVVATSGSVKQAEAQAAVYTRRADKARAESSKAAGSVEGRTVTIRARVGAENRLYGSVTAADISEALRAEYGLDVDRRKIELDEAIHRVGTYSATVDFGHGTSAKVTVEVVPETAGAHGRAGHVVGAEAEEARPEVETPAEAQQEEDETAPTEA
jgi:large subunit ribosomal protein L9